MIIFIETYFFFYFIETFNDDNIYLLKHISVLHFIETYNDDNIY